MIQDYIMMAASVALTCALVPQVIKGAREKAAGVTLLTSGITGIALYVMCMCAVTLDLTFTASVWWLTGTLWLVLFGQRVVYGR